MEKDLHRILWQRAVDAKARMDEAAGTFLAIMNEVPSGLPHPDGSLRIQNASRDLSAARLAYVAASRALTDYSIRGIVPDDLKK